MSTDFGTDYRAAYEGYLRSLGSDTAQGGGSIVPDAFIDTMAEAIARPNHLAPPRIPARPMSRRWRIKVAVRTARWEARYRVTAAWAALRGERHDCGNEW